MNSPNKIVEIYFECIIVKRDLAWLVENADGNEVWLPISQCEFNKDDRSVNLPEWLAIEKGLV